MTDCDCVLLLSGGLDSLVLLARECHAGRRPFCVSFDYRQRHRRELEAAGVIAGRYRVPWCAVQLPAAPLSGSALTGGRPLPVDVAHDDPAQAATVVPNRNAVFLSLAAALAVQHGAKLVLYAAHAGDAAIYPDCRPEFVAALDAAFRTACGVGVEAPFLAMTKRDIVRLGKQLHAPFDLAWSCYAGGEVPCGACGACRERTGAGA